MKDGSNANQSTHEMCLIHADFKHFARHKPNNFTHPGKVSSIM
jgi:hypothetical protein